ncbi:MAG: hypothetical protein HY905_22790 [Deltaproteobacteria bacterium]|nr:hypothetical protein [Deltaproteobacteria bacterium]
MAQQHADLTEDRWREFDLDRQILMVANEMNRGLHLLEEQDGAGLRRSYERVLRLVDLTVAVQSKTTLRGELLRWRDLVAALYLEPAPSREAHRAAFRCLLQFTPEAARQIPLVLDRERPLA